MDYTEEILKKFKSTSLHEITNLIPSPLTTDAFKEEASNNFNNNKPLDTFHYLALSHSTLLHHNIIQKLHEAHSKKNDTISTFEHNARPNNSQDTLRLIQLLPSDWTVVQITSESKISQGKAFLQKVNSKAMTPSIYISRVECGSKHNIIIKRAISPSRGLRSILEEMKLILEENKVIALNYKNDAKKYLQKKEELNNRLRVLVSSIERSWLKHWSCLFAGLIHPKDTKRVSESIEEAVKSCDIRLNSEQMKLLELMVTAPLSKLGENKLCPAFNLRAGVGKVLNQSIRTDSVRDLSLALSELREKLIDLRESTRSPVILIVDKSVVTLPWEMLEALRNQSVTRMPSLESLICLYSHHSNRQDSVLHTGVDASNGFFILDPDNNLVRTRDRLKDCFADTEWSGVTSQKPSCDQFKSALATKDVFTYVGHGSGSQYMPSQGIESVECRAVVLLYGCSSVSLGKKGIIPDPWGIVLSFLLASSPCVVGMLWEVMDKDTDLITREMTNAMRGLQGTQGSPLEEPPSDLALMVSKARALCNWYLTSAALAIYGLPLHITEKTS